MKQYRVAALLLAAGLAAQADETGDRLRALMEQHAPAIVQIKAVLKTELSRGGQSRERERRVDLLGVVVDPAGLVIVQARTFVSEESRKQTPLDIKVIFEGEEKEYSAFLAALDSKLGLAFLKVEDLGDRKAAAIDFSTTVDPALGDPLASVGRLPKGFDCRPYFQTARVCAEIQKPRHAWVLDGGAAGFGLPLFTHEGKLAGILSSLDGADGETGSSPFGFDRSMRVLLPGSVVQATIEQAKKQAVEVAAERAKQAAEAPKTGPDPANTAPEGAGEGGK